MSYDISPSLSDLKLLSCQNISDAFSFYFSEPSHIYDSHQKIISIILFHSSFLFFNINVKLFFFFLDWAGSSLWCRGSLVVVCGFSCTAACGILVPQPGAEPVSPALKDRFLTTGSPGKSSSHCSASY